MSHLHHYLATALSNNHYVIDEVTQSKMLAFVEMLDRWNRAFNLTAIRDLENIVLLHLIDSLSVKPFLGNSIIDIGSGAGFPGIPLALVEPNKQFVLLDSNGKKTRFLTQVVAELELNHVEIVQSRCQDYKPEHGFDTILTRAFASLKEILLSTQHLVNAQGEFIAMKGVYPQEEIDEIPEDFQVQAVHPIIIQGLTASRHLVCIRKKLA